MPAAFFAGGGKTSTADKTLFALLKDLRKQISRKEDLPPFVIFQDPSLEDMAIQYPIKVDELMQLCDQLEQKQISNQEIHAQLVSTLLTTLTQATDPQAFQAAWTRIAANFDSLFTTESSIEQLKQTILQLAVMGKLVEQEAGDEPASVLLEKIAQEKARLISEGKIKGISKNRAEHFVKISMLKFGAEIL